MQQPGRYELLVAPSNINIPKIIRLEGKQPFYIDSKSGPAPQLQKHLLAPAKVLVAHPDAEGTTADRTQEAGQEE